MTCEPEADVVWCSRMHIPLGMHGPVPRDPFRVAVLLPIRRIARSKIRPVDAPETFAVALVGEIDTGWLVDATSAEEAIDIVYGTVPRAREVTKDDLLVWPGRYYRDLYLAGDPFPESWTRL